MKQFRQRLLCCCPTHGAAPLPGWTSSFGELARGRTAPAHGQSRTRMSSPRAGGGPSTPPGLDQTPGHTERWLTHAHPLSLTTTGAGCSEEDHGLEEPPSPPRVLGVAAADHGPGERGPLADFLLQSLPNATCLPWWPFVLHHRHPSAPAALPQALTSFPVLEYPVPTPRCPSPRAETTSLRADTQSGETPFKACWGLINRCLYFTGIKVQVS